MNSWPALTFPVCVLRLLSVANPLPQMLQWNGLFLSLSICDSWFLAWNMNKMFYSRFFWVDIIDAGIPEMLLEVGQLDERAAALRDVTFVRAFSWTIRMGFISFFLSKLNLQSLGMSIFHQNLCIFPDAHKILESGSLQERLVRCVLCKVLPVSKVRLIDWALEAFWWKL